MFVAIDRSDAQRFVPGLAAHSVMAEITDAVELRTCVRIPRVIDYDRDISVIHGSESPGIRRTWPLGEHLHTQDGVH